MANYTFTHASRNLVVNRNPLYLAGDDLVSRDLVVSRVDSQGRTDVKSYGHTSRNLLLARIPHIGRFSNRTLTHTSRNLIIERSILKGAVTGFALFPEIVPSQVQYRPAKYMVTEHRAQAGAMELHLWTDSNAGATLQLDYINIPDTTAETVMSVWDTVYGTYKSLRIPRSVLAGVEQELAEYMLRGGNKARWFFAEVPKWEGRIKGYGDLRIALVSKITSPI